jgi:hypothetical protein
VLGQVIVWVFGFGGLFCFLLGLALSALAIILSPRKG